MLKRINRNWSIKRRLAVIAVAGFLPVFPVMFQTAKNDLEHVEVAKSEIEGVEHQKLIFAAMISKSPAERQTADANLRSARLGGGHQTASVREAFLGAVDPVDRAVKGRDLMIETANWSGLALDPDATSYYVIDIVSLRAPAILAANARLKAALALPTGDPATFATISRSVAVLDDQIKSARRTLQILEATSRGEAAGRKLRFGFAKLDEALKGIEQFVNSNAASDVKSLLNVPDSIDSGIEALWANGSEELAEVLKARASAELNHLYTNSAISLLLGIAALVFALYVAKSFGAAIATQVAALERISREDESTEIACADCTNENGAIANALLRLKDGVIERKRLAEQTARQAAEAERLNAFYASEHEKFMEVFRAAATELAKGNFDHRIDAKVIDEYSEIVAVFNRTLQSLAEGKRTSELDEQKREVVVEQLRQALSSLASGDLRSRIEAEVAPEYERLKTDFNAAIQQLELTVAEVKSGTSSMRLGTDEISQASDDLSRRTENQAANLEQTAAAVAEITSTVAKTSQNADSARDVVSDAKADAEKGGAIVARAIEAMSAIEKSSTQISQIIGVIDEIAFQTNLLALNAGVEAARAGDAGRGFAVVASEVRALAQRSAEAAKEIKRLISTSTSQVAQGVELVGETGRSLERIVGRVSEINVSVEVIASSAREQATALSQVNTAVSQMDQVTQQNAAMVEEATAATRTLQQQADELSSLVDRFRTNSEAHRDALVQASRTMGAAASRKGLAKVGASTMGRAATKEVRAVSNGGWEEF